MSHPGHSTEQKGDWRLPGAQGENGSVQWMWVPFGEMKTFCNQPEVMAGRHREGPRRLCAGHLQMANA